MILTMPSSLIHSDAEPAHRRVLLIDDDIDFANANADFLEEFGYEVKVAHDEHQALDILSSYDPQIALIDINLGQSNGIDLIPLMRKVTPDLICIMLTGNADIESPIKALRLGANDYLRKPVNLEDLLAVLERCAKTQKLEQDKRAADIAREEANAASRAKSQFLSTMSHELRTPLNAVLGFAQILDSDSNEPLTENQKIIVDFIIRGGNNLLDLVNQVLDLNKIEAEGLDLNTEYIPVSDIVEGSIDLLRSRANQDGVQICDQTANLELPLLWTDKEQLTKALSSLLSNAIKYNSEGGTVTVACENIPDDKLRISVQDTGEGISIEDQPSLFMPFERLGREAGKIEGAGIGLLLTRQIIELLGGNIGFESEAGKGSTFWLDVPLSS